MKSAILLEEDECSNPFLDSDLLNTFVTNLQGYSSDHFKTNTVIQLPVNDTWILGTVGVFVNTLFCVILFDPVGERLVFPLSSEEEFSTSYEAHA